MDSEEFFEKWAKLGKDLLVITGKVMVDIQGINDKDVNAIIRDSDAQEKLDHLATLLATFTKACLIGQATIGIPSLKDVFNVIIMVVRLSFYLGYTSSSCDLDEDVWGQV